MRQMPSQKVEGLAELDRILRSFGPKVAKNGLRSSNFSATKVFVTAIKRDHTYKDQSGLLTASVVSPRRRGPDNEAKHSIVVRGTKKSRVTKVARSKKTGKYHEVVGPAVYGKMIEFGTSKMAARPFVRPAIRDNLQAAIEADKQGLVKACERAAKK